MAADHRRAEDEETITPTRILTIEHNVANIKGSMGYLRDTIEANEIKMEAFQKIVLEKLDGKSDFDLQKTMKIVISTIVIVGAAITALDYRMESKMSVPLSNGVHRDKAITLLQDDNERMKKRMSSIEILQSDTQSERSMLRYRLEKLEQRTP